jgi:hypothetical protein
MSWDILLFNSQQKIQSLEALDEAQLVPTDFCSAFESYFDNITKGDNHREVKGDGFAIDYFIDNEPVSNKIISLYGEKGLYELVTLARTNNWQIFDTGLGQMIDLENPSVNGYENFQSYLKHVLSKKE